MTSAVISGTFSDLKTVKTRGVLQMVIEVPIEKGAAVVKAFGFPQPGAEIPVAVARLIAAPSASDEPKPVSEVEPLASPKRELTMAQKAALFVQEKDAQGRCIAARYFVYNHGETWRKSPRGESLQDQADSCMKALLKISSKTELNRNPDAAAAFERISKDCWRWRNEPTD